MNFDKFIKTDIAKQLRFQRVVYIVSPVSNKKLGINGSKFIKIGISKCDLFSRMRCYKTYWNSGINIHCVCVINQPHEGKLSYMQCVKEVESFLCDSKFLSKYRLKNTETFYNPNSISLVWTMSQLKKHSLTLKLWQP